MDNKYIDVIPDQPIAEGYNSDERELDVPDFPQGEQKVKTVKVDVEDIESGEKVSKKLGEYQGELSPNPGYGEDGETKDATKIHLVKESIPVDGGKFFDQKGIRVEREPVNYVGGLYVKGKPVNPEEGSDDSNVYRFAVGEVMTDEIASLLKSGDVLLVNNMAFVINKINSDHAWFRGYYSDGSVEGKITVAQLEWENRGDKKLAITFNEVSGFKHEIDGDLSILGNIDVSGDGKGIITCNALLQKPRYEFDFDLPDYTGFTKKQWYTKVIIIGNECHIIGNAYYLNTGESPASQRFTQFEVEIPSEIGQFIYDSNGKALTENPTSGDNYIRSGFVSNTSGVSNVHSLRIQHSSYNRLLIYEVDNSSVPAGDKIVKGFHITLILAE